MASVRNVRTKAFVALAALAGCLAYASATTAAWRLSSLGIAPDPLALIPASETENNPSCRSAMEAYAVALSRSRIAAETPAGPSRERRSDRRLEAASAMGCPLGSLLAYGQAGRQASDEARLAGGLASPKPR